MIASPRANTQQEYRRPESRRTHEPNFMQKVALFDREIRQEHHPDRDIGGEMYGRPLWAPAPSGGAAAARAGAPAPPRPQRPLLEGQGSEGLRRPAERAHRARRVAERHRLPEARYEGRRRRQDEALDIMLVDAARVRRLHRIGRNHDAVRLEWRATMLDRLDLDDQPVVARLRKRPDHSVARNRPRVGLEHD